MTGGRLSGKRAGMVREHVQGSGDAGASGAPRTLAGSQHTERGTPRQQGPPNTRFPYPISLLRLLLLAVQQLAGPRPSCFIYSGVLSFIGARPTCDRPHPFTRCITGSPLCPRSLVIGRRTTDGIIHTAVRHMDAALKATRWATSICLSSSLQRPIGGWLSPSWYVRRVFSGRGIANAITIADDVRLSPHILRVACRRRVSTSPRG
ncbi:hypothetical protein OH76DRAFT_64970 [Lentinus brumalis]|uniref:Uncharacterized protein n=1 Tax=Lentinus brumalis TaxID=2498619 RepID=A0A371DKH9_9APHY|nr:hypothetical protein OH76DRAFT_64970 [Polyporus brumalis]